jgi:hypothetical protein
VLWEYPERSKVALMPAPAFRFSVGLLKAIKVKGKDYVLCDGDGFCKGMRVNQNGSGRRA